jgi:CelD/BcsL family acetyltransferase involved in cellulose biosynthesis
MNLGLERVPTLQALREEWGALTSTSANIFGTWEFADTWWRHLGLGRTLHLYACRDGDRLVAILPLFAWRERPVRVLRFLGAREGDELGPIHAGLEPTTLAAALNEAGARSRADVVLAEHLPGDQDWARVLHGRHLRREGNPVLPFETRDWDDYLAGRSPNFRSNLRRRARRLAEQHDVRFRNAAGDRADFELLFKLHNARWGRETRYSRHRCFHAAFGRLAAERGWLRLWILELDGRPVAACQGFRFGGTESYYQAGRNPALDPFAVGLLTLAHSVRSAMEDGRREYRFLRGSEPYKYQFTSLDPGLDSIAVPRGRAGALAVATGLAARATRGVLLRVKATRSAAERVRLPA